MVKSLKTNEGLCEVIFEENGIENKQCCQNTHENIITSCNKMKKDPRINNLLLKVCNCGKLNGMINQIKIQIITSFAPITEE